MFDELANGPKNDDFKWLDYKKWLKSDFLSVHE
jgi:hypothetical protein